MVRITTTKSAKNLSLSIDGAEDAKVGSKISSMTRSAKNLSTSVDIAEDAGVDEGDGGDDKMVKRLPLYKKLNKPTGYLTSLRSGKRWLSFDSFGYG